MTLEAHGPTCFMSADTSGSGSTLPACTTSSILRAGKITFPQSSERPGLWNAETTGTTVSSSR
jgi:hypothetical protein